MNRFVKWIDLFLRLFIGLVFLYSGLTKLTEPIENFYGVLRQYQLLPSVLIPVIAHVIPWIEFIFGLFLFLGYMTRLSSGVLTLMTLSFVALLGFSKLAGGELPLECGCFGQGSMIHLTPMQVILLDIFNFFGGVKLLLTADHLFSFDRWARKGGK
ncbi:MAG: DoxX family membrane protein [Candidatus Omnitrophica bacterium]|nr:DoxX family membrane protein [Candidatus Omnitrophota bacterium]